MLHDRRLYSRRNHNLIPGGSGTAAAVFTHGAILLFCVAGQAMAQTGLPNPCGVTGSVVYDAVQGVCWLANANLAGDPNIVAMMGVTGVNPNGTMDFLAAQNWVAALNSFHGSGYLGHNNWQLPVAPLTDNTCATGNASGNFGPLCEQSAMGNLYYVTFGLKYPNSVAPWFGAPGLPFERLKLSYYWTLDNDNGNQEVFSFANDLKGGVTTKYTYYYVLPMVPGALSNAPTCLPGDGVLPYTAGVAAGRAVYDCITGYTWPMDANLAAHERFSIKGYTKIPDNHGNLIVPLIDRGRMLFATANQWITSMQTIQYLNSSGWQIPANHGVLETLLNDLNLSQGDSRLMFGGSFGSFTNLQPFYYWGCQATQPGIIESPCTGYAPQNGDQVMQWTFNFDYGFQGTAEISQKFFVMVYYPAPPPTCFNPIQCCIQNGGQWINGHCE